MKRIQIALILFLCSFFLAACGNEKHTVTNKSSVNGQKEIKQEIIIDWNPYLDAVLATDWSIDEVCGAKIGDDYVYLVHFTKDAVDEEWQNIWWMMTKFHFNNVGNNTYVLNIGNGETGGKFISAPTTLGLPCKKK